MTDRFDAAGSDAMVRHADGRNPPKSKQAGVSRKE